MKFTDTQRRIFADCGYLPQGKDDTDEDYWQYICTMDIIESAHRPGHKITENLMEMIRTKIDQIKNPELRSHTQKTYEESF